MILDLTVHLHYRMARATDLLLQVEAANLSDQPVLSSGLTLTGTAPFTRIAAEDRIGERIWLHVEQELVCDYQASVQVIRPAPDISGLAAAAPQFVPGDIVKYLMPSRYCPADEFQNFVTAEFGSLQGGARIAAMRDWIRTGFLYAPGCSNSHTTAMDTFVQRQGICRDFAHVLITLARASAIPARFASVYAPGVTPQDFHAVAEVWLDGSWHLVDPTGMAGADEIARIGVGQDAADVAFITSYGPLELIAQWVTVGSRLQ